MVGDVVRKAGEGVGNAVGAGGESVAGGYIGFMFSPWGLALVIGIFLLIKWIR
jgi:hypothetical protein